MNYGKKDILLMPEGHSCGKSQFGELCHAQCKFYGGFSAKKKVEDTTV